MPKHDIHSKIHTCMYILKSVRPYAQFEFVLGSGWVQVDLLVTSVLCNLEYQSESHLNTLRPRQNGRHFADDIFKCIFLNENKQISIKISLKFVL